MRKSVDGLVLREVAVGENDKLLTVLCADEGRFLMTAKGVRSMKSKLIPVCRMFTYANFEYYEKNGRRWLAGGSVNDSFFGLNSDLAGFSLAAYVVDVAHEITGENMEAGDVLRMVLNTLYAIEKKLKPYAQIKAVFELFAAISAGMEPDVSGCSVCGKQAGDFWLDVMNGHLICPECLNRRNGNLPLPEVDAFETRNILLFADASAVAAMRYVLSALPERIFAFGLIGEDSMRAFCRIAESYLLHHLERGFDTLDFYKSVKE